MGKFIYESPLHGVDRLGFAVALVRRAFEMMASSRRPIITASEVRADILTVRRTSPERSLISTWSGLCSDERVLREPAYLSVLQENPVDERGLGVAKVEQLAGGG